MAGPPPESMQHASNNRFPPLVAQERLVSQSTVYGILMKGEENSIPLVPLSRQNPRHDRDLIAEGSPLLTAGT